ncbi:MAG: DNA primase [Coriobacteriales bacterium]|jgi:DNA primase|nr:DNA primase [Coriobacteriales bacterium]
MISDDDVKRVRDATDIVTLISERLVLKQRGREFWGCCPFHNEKTPSFKVDPVSQFYHCFGCGEGGDAFKFIMKSENVGFLDSIRILAQRANIELSEETGGASSGKKARLLAACEETVAFYHQQLMRVKNAETDAARAYLAKRNMGGTVAREWRLGFAPGNGSLARHLQREGFNRDELVAANVVLSSQDEWRTPRDRFFNRIIFPIFDLQGRAIAFGGRTIGQSEPKYLNSSDTSLFHKRDNLYAINRAKASITAKGSAVVVEGYTDAIAMHGAGFTNTVATLGTALTPQHLKLLARFTTRVVLLFDGDEAGQRAADKVTELIGTAVAHEQERKADLFVAMLPETMDPADFCEERGADATQEVLDAAIPLLRFSLDRRLAKWDLTQPEQRMRALNDVVPLLIPVKNTLLAADYLNYLADVFAVDYTVVANALKTAKPPLTYRDRTSAYQGNASLGAGGAGAAGAAANAGGAAGANAGGTGTENVDGAAADAGGAAANGANMTATDAAVKANRISTFERELIFLYIEHPEVRERLREAFGRITWGDSRHEAIAKILLDLDATEEADSLLAHLTARMPDVSEILSSVRLPEFAELPPTRVAGMLMFSIKEAQLKQSIHSENAQLRRLPANENTERDQLFQHIAELQQELTELRKKYRTE